MTNQVYEAPSLYPELVQQVTPPGKGQHGYYRRGDNGWIITGPVWPSYRADMEYKDNVFLAKYGVFLYDMPGNKTVFDVNGRNFSPVTEPWRQIFQKGGAKEFPLDQIIAFRWHIRPPYREVKFPQLAQVEIHNFFCPECDKGIFSAVRRPDAVDQLRIHLTSRFNDNHSYRPDDLKALGEEYGINFFEPRQGMNRVTRSNLIDAPDGPDLDLVPGADDLTPNDALTCPECSFEAKSAIGLNSHMRSHRKVAAPV